MGADRLLRIHDSSIPDPELLYAVPLKNGNGTFPHFSHQFNHGFVWGNPQNLSYRAELGHFSGNPEIKRDAMLTVHKRVRAFLESLGIKNYQDLVIAAPSIGDTRIVELNSHTLRTADVWSDNRGRYIEGGAFFLQRAGIPVFSLANDCPVSLFEASRPGLDPVVGFSHTSRGEAEGLFPKKVIEYLESSYGCDPGDIKIGIMPSLEPEHHFVRFDTFDRDIQIPPMWQHYMIQDSHRQVYHLDLRSMVADQYIQAGVPPENIFLSLVGTFDGAAKGVTFSHRHATMSMTRPQATGIAFDLRT